MLELIFENCKGIYNLEVKGSSFMFFNLRDKFEVLKYMKNYNMNFKMIYKILIF